MQASQRETTVMLFDGNSRSQVVTFNDQIWQSDTCASHGESDTSPVDDAMTFGAQGRFALCANRMSLGLHKKLHILMCESRTVVQSMNKCTYLSSQRQGPSSQGTKLALPLTCCLGQICSVCILQGCCFLCFPALLF